MASGGEEKKQFDMYDFPKNIEKDGPVEVMFSIYINNIYNLDSVNETYKVSFDICFEWEDGRVAYRDEAEALESPYAWKKKPDVNWEEVWSPKLCIMDMSESDERENQKEVIGRKGVPKVTWWMHMTATVGSLLDLREFPYDTQNLHLNWRSTWYYSKQVKFVPTQQQLVSLNENVFTDMRLNEFVLLNVGCSTLIHCYPMLQKLEGHDNGLFDNLRITFTLRRRPEYYVSKIVSLFFVIFLMTGGSFFLAPDAPGDRNSINVTLFLTAVAFQFVIEGNLPKIGYGTKMDTLIAWNYFWILFNFVESIIVFQLSDNETGTDKLWQVDLTCLCFYYFGGCCVYLWFLWPMTIIYFRPEADYKMNATRERQLSGQRSLPPTASGLTPMETDTLKAE